MDRRICTTGLETIFNGVNSDNEPETVAIDRLDPNEIKHKTII